MLSGLTEENARSNLEKQNQHHAVRAEYFDKLIIALSKGLECFLGFRLLLIVICLNVIHLAGCSTLAERGLLPEVANRSQPTVVLGQEVPLFDKTAKHISSLISSNGHAHLFVMDENGKLFHIEVENDHVISQVEFDTIATGKTNVIDTVKQANGQIRLLAGDRQYIFQNNDQPPRKIKGNRCEKFLSFGDRLFCAFIISGKEAGSPKRIDVTAGWFILVPIAFWSTEQANKLVLAEEVAEQWHIRAVVDPDSNLDADHDFVARIDSQNQLNFLYFASRGGGMFGLVLGAGGGFIPAVPEWRYANIRMDRLKLPEANISLTKPTEASSIKQWIPIMSTNLDLMNMPYLDKLDQSALKYPEELSAAIRPLNRHFIINPSTGNPSGLLWGSLIATDFLGQSLSTEKRKIGILVRDMWFEIQRDKDTWSSGFTVVAAEDLPDPSYQWSLYDPLALVKVDQHGTEHALLLKGGLWGDGEFSIEYFLKNKQGWFAPIKLGNHKRIFTCCRDMVIADSGEIFAVWTDAAGKLVGRWLRKL